jgi:hypothetical protein
MHATEGFDRLWGAAPSGVDPAKRQRYAADFGPGWERDSLQRRVGVNTVDHVDDLSQTQGGEGQNPYGADF